MSFVYAHKNTSEGERATRTSALNKCNIQSGLQAVRDSAFKREIPVSDDETLNFLTTLLTALQPAKILELGTAVGVSGAAMLDCCKNAHLTTVERDKSFYEEARENFVKFGFADRVTAICGDAGEIIEKLEESYDFIFLDCAKVQYIKYLPRLKKLLNKGGVLLADDVLLFGYITGDSEVPKKRKMLVQHVKEYISAVTNDEELITTILDIGNGLSFSVKKQGE